MNKKNVLMLLTLVVISSLFSGCAYLRNRGMDAMDMFEAGLLVSAKPGFAVYSDVIALPFGVSYVDGKIIGIGRSSLGVYDFRQKGYGYILGGKLQRGVGDYDPADNNDPQTYDTGIIGIANKTDFWSKNPPSEQSGRPLTRKTCPKTVHLGWIGFEWGCKAIDLVDFLLGWTTIDIGNDDEPRKVKLEEKTEQIEQIQNNE